MAGNGTWVPFYISITRVSAILVVVGFAPQLEPLWKFGYCIYKHGPPEKAIASYSGIKEE